MNDENKRRALLRARYASEKLREIRSTLNRSVVYDYEISNLINLTKAAISSLKELKEILEEKSEKKKW